MIPQPTRRIVIATASVLAVAVTATAGSAVALSHREVSIEVDGATTQVSGFFGTVDDALAAGGVEVGEHDLVAPSADSSVSDGDTVVVRTAAQYSVEVDGESVNAWSTADSVDGVLDSVESDGVVVLAADRSSTREALPASGEATTIKVEADGGTVEVEMTDSDDAESLLAKAGIEASPLDRVEFVSEGGVLALRVHRVTRGMATETSTIEHSTEEREDDSIYKGETQVVQAGSDGSVTTTSYRETVDGEVVVDVVLSEARTDAVPEIIAVGAKEKEAASSASSVTSTSTGGDIDAMLAKIAQCESGGNPTTNTGNGYYGMYQFSLPTWQSVGGTGLPSDASAEEQTMRAKILQARSGWGQWGCSPY